MTMKINALILGLMLATPVLADEGAPFDFATVDTDGDGQITAAEMTAFRAAKMAEVDQDKDGFVSAAEMRAEMLARIEARLDKMVAHRMERQDQNGDGKLGPDEFGPGDRAENMFDRADENGDGSLSKAEVEAMQAHMREKMQERHGKGKHGMGMHGMGWFFEDGYDE